MNNLGSVFEIDLIRSILMESMSHTKRSTTLEELANALIFASSDQSSGMTGAVLNLTGGMISD